MLSQGGIYDSTVEKDLGCFGDGAEDLKGFIVFLVVVVVQGLHPGLNLLSNVSPAQPALTVGEGSNPTCLMDMSDLSP